MTVLPFIIEFGNVIVVDSGIPNKERIVMRPTEPVNLLEFSICVGIGGDKNSVRLGRDFFFTFDELKVFPPSWVVVYTGIGAFQELKHPDTHHPIYCFYWGRKETLFNFADVVPVMFRLGSILIGRHDVPPSALLRDRVPKQIASP